MKIKDRAKAKLPPVEPGVYIALCVYSLDLGEQLCEYKDKGKAYNNQVQLVFELCGESVEIDGKQEPRTLSRTFNMTTSKNGGLRKFVQSWLGKPFSDEEFANLDTCDLVGRAAQLSVILNESGEYANIDGVMQLPKGVPSPAPQLPLIRWDIEPWSDEIFGKLPTWAQEKIKKSTQYQQLHTPTDNVDFTEPVQAVQPVQSAPMASKESTAPLPAVLPDVLPDESGEEDCPF